MATNLVSLVIQFLTPELIGRLKFLSPREFRRLSA